MSTFRFPPRPAGAAGYLANERRLFPASTLLIKPIRRLYVAGEISSIYDHLYLEAGNITECFVAGKIAGQNAAEEVAWD